MDWNPGAPNVLGPEWLASASQKTRVFSGSDGRMLRLPSTTAETIDALRLSANVDPLLREDARTIVDIIEEGNETTPLFKPRLLLPNSDVTVGGWRTQSGSATNLFQSLDETPDRWPGPAEDTWIRNFEEYDDYECTVDASDFAAAGIRENARIGFVSVKAIFRVEPTGFRKIRVALRYQGTTYSPAGGNLRNIHAYGERHVLWWGELNPVTGLPWTPADIASFDVGGDWVILVRSQSSSSSKYPLVHALALEVVCANQENREAVAVWRRPEDGSLDERLENVTTDDLISVPSGAPGWSKTSGTNYLYYWRQSVSPALFGPVVADDVRWNGSFQDLGPGGEPPGITYPLHPSGSNPPLDVIASDLITYDFNGRPERAFDGRSRAAYAIALIDDLGNPSVDSQPYRIDIQDVVALNATSPTVGQRMTPAASGDYLGVRMAIIPPSTANGNLIFTVHRVSDGVQTGGSFSITAQDVRALPKGQEGIRYVTGFLSAGAALVASTQYEVRLTTNITSQNWFTFVADVSIAPETSFGGTANGAVINGVHNPNRDLLVNLIRQPDPPTNVTAGITNVPITTSAGEVTTVEHVAVSWDAPVVGMGGLFARYEVERQLDGGDWVRVGNINNSAILNLPDDDHEVPRDTEATYRVRAVGTDGRISAWAVSNAAIPTAPGLILILTSNYDPSLEVVHLYDRESSYPVLSTGHNETISLYGSNNQVVFMESEDRGIGWSAEVTLNQVVLAGKGGVHVLRPLMNLVRSLEIPYVCAMDHQGTRILGHIEVEQARRDLPNNIYKAMINVVPTHDEPVPVEVV